MKSAPVAWTLVAVVFLGGAIARAQSLADIAKKEEERRKAVKTTGKVYTNDDLKAYPTPAAPATPAEPAAGDKAAAGAAGAAPASGDQAAADAAKGTDTGEQKDEAYWKGLLSGERTKLERNQQFADALQSQINGLTNDFYARDDPAQRSVIWTQRTKAIDELDRVKKDIAEGSKAIAKIQEDARKAGVPPGWLR